MNKEKSNTLEQLKALKTLIDNKRELKKNRQTNERKSKRL